MFWSSNPFMAGNTIVCDWGIECAKHIIMHVVLRTFIRDFLVILKRILKYFLVTDNRR